MKRKKQAWEIGDVFTVPTSDGRYAVGQAIDYPGPLRSVAVALFAHIVNTLDEALARDVLPAKLISTVFTTDDLLASGRWHVAGAKPVSIPAALFPGEHTKARGGVGNKVIGSANLATFVEAYFGLGAWDFFADPTYMDQLLISPDKKPKKLVLKAVTQ
jgi:hypothetical protein